MALAYSGIQVAHREIELRNKPQSLLMASPNGTVPVLCLEELILEQSIDIIRWSLAQSDPDGWGLVDEPLAQHWIEKNDGPFKTLLDQYKYPNRYPDLNQEILLNEARELMLEPLELSLQSSQYLLGNKMSWVDVAIFPFIRQFSMVNPQRFQELPFDSTKKWLKQHLDSELFQSVMHKHPIWMD
jgi:glutathione S-transferase